MAVKTIGALLAVLCCAVSSAQERPQARNTNISNGFDSRETDIDPRSTRSLNQSEGLASLGAALESRHRGKSGNDCSHLVQVIYEKAGFPYSYANSSELYEGVDQFRRVANLQPGDLGTRSSACCARGAVLRLTILHIGSGAALLAFSGMSMQLRRTLLRRRPGMRV